MRIPLRLVDVVARYYVVGMQKSDIPEHCLPLALGSEIILHDDVVFYRGIVAQVLLPLTNDPIYIIKIFCTEMIR